MIRSLVVVAILALAGPAYADEPAPWAVGVTEKQKAEANTRLAKGNQQFIDREFTQALATYREAITFWDHPAIRFNIVRCLVQLGQTVEAADNLTRALRYGAAPLEDAVYTEALAYQKLLAPQVGELVVTCDQPGVKLTIDGKPAGTCPTRVTQRLAPGTHQVLGAGAGLLPHAQDVEVVGARTITAKLRLDAAGTGSSARSLGKVAVYGGLGLVAVSGGLGLYAWRSYRGQFPDHCLEREGERPLCDVAGSDAVDRALRIGDVSTVTVGLGVLAIAAGAVVLWRSPRRETVVTPAARGTGLAITSRF